MSGTEIALIVLAVVLVLAVVAAVVLSVQRNRRLKETFGPEYDRTVEETGSRRKAVIDLTEREQRHDKLAITPLDDEARQQYAEAWTEAQARFVDAPHLALVDADRLITAVMQERGYPTGDADQQERDLSVEHAEVLGHYRLAREVYDRNEQGQASTEELREAMVHYRALFADLVESDQVPTR